MDRNEDSEDESDDDPDDDDDDEEDEDAGSELTYIVDGIRASLVVAPLLYLLSLLSSSSSCVSFISV